MSSKDVFSAVGVEGTFAWRARRGVAGRAGKTFEVTALFAGRGAPADRGETLALLAPAAPPAAWVRQVHGLRVIEADVCESGEPGREGELGEADALVGRHSGIALSIATADCVPVLLAGPEGVAAAHAGWRGLAGGVLPATLDHLSRSLRSRLEQWVAWIGPTIGACCYEVGDDVVARVVAASAPEVAHRRARGTPGGRCHLDLQRAAQLQLARGGIGETLTLGICTRCVAGKLHSFRRDGSGAGCNHAFIWSRREGQEPW